jgi:hypothetical protein
LSWPSTTGLVYTLWGCNDLLYGEFSATNTAIPATPPLNIYTATVDAADCTFYFMTVESE